MPAVAKLESSSQPAFATTSVATEGNSTMAAPNPIEIQASGRSRSHQPC